MANPVYTILIVTKGGRAPRGIQVSQRAVSVFLLLLFTVAVGITLLAKSHGQLVDETARLAGVDEENTVLGADLERLEGELQWLMVQMAGLEALGQEVREIVSVDDVGDSRIALQGRSGLRTDSSLEEKLLYLIEIVPQRTEEMAVLLSDAEQYRIKMAHTPDIWPTEGRITSPFGWRRAPFTLRRHFHQGIDIGAPSGAPVKAAAEGVVKEARYRAGWGNLIIIDHGEYITYYAHLRRISIKNGAHVVKGQLIGEVGSTGYSTGPHLHFEIHYNGEPIDPLTLLEREVSLDGV